MNSEPWVLPEELRQLAEGGDGDLVREVLTVFHSDTAKRLAMMRAALTANDRTKLKGEAHAVKGSAAQVGAGRVAALCRKMESEASALSEGELDSLLADIETAFADVCRQMQV
jgi:hypothetical protein